jgi:hypothetical protein
MCSEREVMSERKLTGIVIVELKPGQQHLTNVPGVLFLKAHNRLKQKLVIRVDAETLAADI